MLITDEENKERDHPFIAGQAIWSSISLEIESCPFFLVCSEVRESGAWFRQTSIVYGLRNLLVMSQRIQNNQDERFAQVALLSAEGANLDKPWSMYNLHEIWIEETSGQETREIYITEERQEIHYSCTSTNSHGRRRVMVFAANRPS